MPLLIRPHERSEIEELCQLFYKTIYNVNCRDYSPEQINAWAPDIPQPEIVLKKFCQWLRSRAKGYT